MSVAEKFADHALGLRFEDLDEDTVDVAKKIIADTLAASLLGSSMPWSAAITRTMVGEGDLEEGSVLGTGRRIPAGAAAFVNGSYAHANDFDDFYAYGPLHPSAAVWTALPLVEKFGLSGRDLILSVAIGYDLCVRIAEAVFSTPPGEKAFLARGFHPQAVCGVFSSAAQAARLMDLDRLQTVNAIGIAGSFAGGTTQFMEDASDTKRFHFGKASQAGILAASLAQNGFRGPSRILEGEKGFLNSVADHYSPGELTRGLGSDFRVHTAFLKRVSTMGGNLGCVDALLQILEEEHVSVASVVSIRASLRNQFRGYSVGLGAEAVAARYHPPDRYSSEMSLPYVLGVTLTRGALPQWSDFGTETRSDADVLENVGRVQVEFPDEMNKLSRKLGYAAGAVMIEVESGERYRRTVREPRGHPANPLTWDDLRTKWRTVTEVGVEEHAIELIFSELEELELVRDVREFVSLWPTLSGQL